MAAKTLVTTFDDAHEAERAVQKLHQDGFPASGIGWVESDRGGREIAHGNLVETHDATPIHVMVIGAVLGALIGLLCGAMALTLLGVGRSLLLVGELVCALLGLGLGIAVSRRLDAYSHVEVPRPRAHRYGKRLSSGEASVMVTVGNEQEEARALEIIRGEASLHQHDLAWRVSLTAAEQRPSLW